MLRGDQVPCRLAFRVPGWSDGIKVSYRCGGREGRAAVNAQGLTVTAAANQSVQPETVSYRDGYLYIEGIWQDGDEVNLEMEMLVRILEADPRVREDIGKVAIVRGPIVYCLEEADNGKNLHQCRVDLQTLSPTDIQTETTQELGHPMTVLKVPGKRLIPSEGGALYRAAQPDREEDVTLRMIPYYAWNNRGEGEMSVWVRR